MSRPRTLSALALLLWALALGASAQSQQKQPDPGSVKVCDEACQQKLLADAAAVLAKVGSCGKSSCTPGPVFTDRRAQLVLPPADMEKVILGMALLARSQGLQPQQLASRIAQVKLP